MMLEAFGVAEENWRDVAPARPTSRCRSRPATSAAPSPRWPPIPSRARWNQRSVTSGELAEAYGFTDVDGTQPDVWRYIADSRGTDSPPDPDEYR